MYDCIIVGGGPAGLTAAIYLARYRRTVLVYDAGASRALRIPKSHNYPGFANGISGQELLRRLRDQLQVYKVELRAARVDTLEQSENGFVATSGPFEGVSARSILVATGISDKVPKVAGLEQAVLSSIIRFCPVCDAYEAIDKKVAVLGPPDSAIEKALFLRTYSRSVTILTSTRVAPESRTKMLESSGLHIAPKPPRNIRVVSGGVEVLFGEGESERFDVLYPALGCDVHSELARKLGVRCNDIGLIEVDDKQRTSVADLYAAGDVVSDLHQLSVASGHAAIAATAIHNALPRNLR